MSSAGLQMSASYHQKSGRGHAHHPSLLGKGNTTISLISKSKQKKQENSNTKERGSSDHNLVAPIRQTASIFKQPVTVYKDHKSRVKNDLKLVNREKPAQLFWTKRLGNLSPSSYAQESEDITDEIDEEESDDEIKVVEQHPAAAAAIVARSMTAVGPGITETMLLASISTHLHLSKDSAFGQKESQAGLEKNPTAFINPNQPLMSSMTVSDDDIQAAEQRVRQARIRLAQAIKSLG